MFLARLLLQTAVFHWVFNIWLVCSMLVFTVYRALRDGEQLDTNLPCLFGAVTNPLMK